MSETIERMARAFAESLWETIEWPPRDSDCEGLNREDFIKAATAAIEVLRKPNQKMLDAVSFNADKYSAEERTDGKWIVINDHRSNLAAGPFDDPDIASDTAENLGAEDAINAFINAALGLHHSPDAHLVLRAQESKQ